MTEASGPEVARSEGDEPASLSGLDLRGRRVAAATVAAAGLGWWPAFTLGVYGVVFFEQHLALWAAATSAFLAAVLMGGRRMLRRPAAWTLLLPSLWLLLTWLLPVGGSTPVYQVLFWFGVVVTLLGMPVLAAFLVRLLIPDTGRLHGRELVVAMSVVGVVMVCAYVLGTQHPRLLTCDDFTISGNFAPSTCSPGTSPSLP